MKIIKSRRAVGEGGCREGRKEGEDVSVLHVLIWYGVQLEHVYSLLCGEACTQAHWEINEGLGGFIIITYIYYIRDTVKIARFCWSIKND